MAAEHGPGGAAAVTVGRQVAARLGLAALPAAVVTGARVIAGLVHQPDYSASIFGQAGIGALALKSWLASIALVLAAGQVVLALWLYRRLPGLPAPGRWVVRAHRLTGVTLIAVTLPVAVHCLIAYGAALTSLRVGLHSLAGCFLYGRSRPRSCWCTAAGCPAGRCRPWAGRWPRSSPCSGTPPRCGTCSDSSCPACDAGGRRGCGAGCGPRGPPG